MQMHVLPFRRIYSVFRVTVRTELACFFTKISKMLREKLE